ncbi:MAG: ABC transporter permease, partial [Leadbetterella sp.]
MQQELLVAKQFWNTAFKSKAVFFLLFFVGILLVFSLFGGWNNYHQQNKIRTKYQVEARKDWLENPDKHPHRMAHYGNFAFRPKPVLSILDFGMESFMGNTIFLEAHVQNTTNFSEAEFSTGLLRFGEISAAMILQVLFPLLIFFLGFGSIASERENGTLKIILSQGIHWRQIIVGKSLGILLVVLTLFLPFCIFVLMFCVLNQEVSIDESWRTLLLIVFYFLYLGIFCVLAALISA